VSTVLGTASLGESGESGAMRGRRRFPAAGGGGVFGGVVGAGWKPGITLALAGDEAHPWPDDDPGLLPPGAPGDAGLVEREERWLPPRSGGERDRVWVGGAGRVCSREGLTGL